MNSKTRSKGPGRCPTATFGNVRFPVPVANTLHNQVVHNDSSTGSLTSPPSIHITQRQCARVILPRDRNITANKAPAERTQNMVNPNSQAHPTNVLKPAFDPQDCGCMQRNIRDVSASRNHEDSRDVKFKPSFGRRKERRPSFPQSETKLSFTASSCQSRAQGKEFRRISSACSSNNHNFQLKPSPAARRSTSWSGGLVSVSDLNYQFKDECTNAVTNSAFPVEQCHKHIKSKNECIAMKTARSELSLLEQKRLQWAKEKEELNGLWSPWGRHQEPSPNSFSPTSSAQMQASFGSPTNIISSTYVANLGISTIPQSHSECYLPPINSTIAQQPRQKAKVWNAEFQPEDYRYENDNPSGASPHCHSSNSNICQSQRSNRGVVHPRKASLPNYMFEGGDGHNSSNCYPHHNKSSRTNGASTNEMWVAMEEDAFTSDYYSSENNNNVESSKQEVLLKPTSRERSYQEEITVQKAIAIRGEKASSPRVFVHKVYAQNGELFAEHDGSQEVIVNTVTVSPFDNPSRHQGRNETMDSSRNQTLPRNHAMRSSLTIGVDASAVDAYQENDRREKEQWLNELEKQREEQRMRKIMEKEERRPRWGDRGIGVGHFWEPSDSENSHLPAPPHCTKGKGSTTNRGESNGALGGGSNGYINVNQYHPGKSHTPPAWLERSLTRMQSSKSQPSLHDPDYLQDIEYTNEAVEADRGGGPLQHQLISSRSLNQSAVDLRSLTGFSSEELQSERTFLRGQNVPIDPDLLSEREKKRLANQEHLEALKKQIEERQQKQREEKEQRLQEEREQEMRMARQRELELQRLEQEKRGKIPVNGDMPNSIEDGAAATDEPPKTTLDASMKSSAKFSTMADHASIPIHDSTEERDIEIVQRQSIMVVRTPSVPDDEDKITTDNASSTDCIHHHPLRRLSRQDQSVMTDASDTMYERTLTPTLQRSRSLSLCRSIREFGTQTELSDGSTSSGSGSTCGSGKDSDKNRSHNSLLDKKAKEKKQQQEKKSEERPRWGSNPVKKQYVKQSEKDPNYITRMKRRHERLRRMEEERCSRVDTGTESEDVSIPFHRIRQRRNNDVSPQRTRGKGITPLKATLPLIGKTETEVTSSAACPAPGSQTNLQGMSTNSGHSSKRIFTSTNDIIIAGDDKGQSNVPSNFSIKNSKSETHLNHAHSSHSRQAADIIDRNFGSVVGINGMGTSEESSGFSTPFLPRRQLDSGSGSTGSGTTGSGSGVQSPDLTYHSYQANKSTREERKYAKKTSGRDSRSQAKSISLNSDKGKNNSGESGTNASTIPVGPEFKSPHKGFIHQKDFDEMPVKVSTQPESYSFEENVTKLDDYEELLDQETRTNKTPTEKKRGGRNSSLNRANTVTGNPSTLPRQRSKPSISPRRKPKSPEKVKSSNIREMQKSSLEDTAVPSFKKVFAETRNEGGGDEDYNDNKTGDHMPDISQQPERPTSPPVPALLKKMQMGLQPDETGRLSSLPTEFPDILAPLPNIPIGVLSPNPALSPHPPSRISSATSAFSTASAPKIDIDIAVTPRNNPDIIRLFEAAEERIKQRQLSAILASNCDGLGSDSAKSRTSFEADIGSISINLEPIMMYPNPDEDMELPPTVPASTRGSEAAIHEAFITSILNRKEVKEQLSARESELSEKGIIEFSIRLPSIPSNATGEEDFVDEYKDPLLTERRRHTAQWLYGGQSVPQKQAILTNLASLKKGIPLQQQQEWKIANSDTE